MRLCWDWACVRCLRNSCAVFALPNKEASWSVQIGREEFVLLPVTNLQKTKPLNKQEVLAHWYYNFNRSFLIAVSSHLSCSLSLIRALEQILLVEGSISMGAVLSYFRIIFFQLNTFGEKLINIVIIITHSFFFQNVRLFICFKSYYPYGIPDSLKWSFMRNCSAAHSRFHQFNTVYRLRSVIIFKYPHTLTLTHMCTLLLI